MIGKGNDVAQDETPRPKRMGRPPRGGAESKRINRTFRVTDDLNARIEAAAAANKRSLSEEIETRLLRSFENEQVYYNFFGGEETYTLMMNTAVNMRSMERRIGKRWFDLSDEDAARFDSAAMGALGSQMNLSRIMLLPPAADFDAEEARMDAEAQAALDSGEVTEVPHSSGKPRD